MKKRWLLTGLMSALSLGAAGSATAGGETADDTAAVAPAAVDSAGSVGRPAGPRLVFRSLLEFAAGEIPESISSDNQGNLYISVGSTIRRRTAAGVVTDFATLPASIFALGVKVGRDGCVYTASTSLEPTVAGSFVWRACEPGAAEQVVELDPAGGPNDLAFDEDDNLYVTDPVLGRVWRVDPEGEASIWVEDPLLAGNPADPALLFRPLGVNGIAFDANERFVYLANTDRGTILRVRTRGQSRAVSVFAQDTRLRGADGVAFDRSGTLLVNVNVTDSVVSVNPGGQVRVLASGGLLDAPSSAAFGAIEGDRRHVYVTASAFSRTLGLQSGTPHPALLVADVLVPGLPLP
ncbi:MAG: hypothetical protein RL685_724 [Pseudomonadota bacterium]